MYITIRALHVLLGALWFGFAAFAAFLLMPAMEGAGPGAAKVAEGLDRRGLVAAMGALAGLTILSGLWLYWRYTAGFNPVISRTHAGMAFGLGGVLGIIAAILGGSVVGRSMKRAAAIAASAAAAPEADRARLLGEAAALRARAHTAGKLVAILLAITIILMATAAYA
jgi:hypothetical protein